MPISVSKLILYYLCIIGGVMVWALLLPRKREVPGWVMESTTVFGGAFLLASCFINLVPHSFLSGFSTPNIHFKIGAAVLAGFLIQILLEQLTQGVEHGIDNSHSGNSTMPFLGLMIGLSLHSFLEGMPLVDSDGMVHQSLFYGIILHNIPIAIVMVSLFIGKGLRPIKSILMLLIFAIMTPLGSLCNLFLLSSDSVVQALVMGVVVGILLHVSVSILFDRGHKSFAWWKLTLIIVAFIAAYFTPGCPEIYG